MGHHGRLIVKLGSALLTLCLVAGFVVLAPVASHAIPSPGDYAFTSGLTGTFHVEGTGSAGHLTAWEIDDPTASTIHWSNTMLLPAGLQVEVTNDSSTFETNEFGHYFFTLNWLTGQWTDYASASEETHVGGFTYEGRTAVPEPSSLGLVASALLGLAGYGWRQRRQAWMQVR